MEFFGHFRRLTPVQRNTFIACFLGWALDAFDFFILTFCITALATQFQGFAAYQREEAETWEHMALTRSRVIAGDAGLAKEIERTIAAVLRRPRVPETLAGEVRAMRALIAQEKGDDDPWDLKLAAGGLLDIEFVAQFLVLAKSKAHPKIKDVSTRAIIVNSPAAEITINELLLKYDDFALGYYLKDGRPTKELGAMRDVARSSFQGRRPVDPEEAGRACKAG